MINSALLLAIHSSLLASTAAIAFAETPIPIHVGMRYEQARRQLINVGWQPYLPRNARLLACQGIYQSCELTLVSLLAPITEEDMQERIRGELARRALFRKNGWHETIHCYGTGLGLCHHSFSNAHGKVLIVETGSGSLGIMPDVTGFYYRETSGE